MIQGTGLLPRQSDKDLSESPCNFGPFTDLAISVFREMSMNIVFTQILTSPEYGL